MKQSIMTLNKLLPSTFARYNPPDFIDSFKLQYLTDILPHVHRWTRKISTSMNLLGNDVNELEFAFNEHG